MLSISISNVKVIPDCRPRRVRDHSGLLTLSCFRGLGNITGLLHVIQQLQERGYLEMIFLPFTNESCSRCFALSHDYQYCQDKSSPLSRQLLVLSSKDAIFLILDTVKYHTESEDTINAMKNSRRLLDGLLVFSGKHTLMYLQRSIRALATD